MYGKMTERCLVKEMLSLLLTVFGLCLPRFLFPTFRMSSPAGPAWRRPLCYDPVRPRCRRFARALGCVGFVLLSQLWRLYFSRGRPSPVQGKKDSSKSNQKSGLMASWLAQFMFLQHKYELEQWSYGHFNFYWCVQKWIWLKERQMRQVQIL